MLVNCFFSNLVRDLFIYLFIYNYNNNNLYYEIQLEKIFTFFGGFWNEKEEIVT